MVRSNWGWQTRGGATVEAAVSLPVVILFFCLSAWSLYGIFLQSALHHQTYEYLLCAEFSNASECEAALRKKISAVIPFGDWKLKTFPPTSETRQVQVHFSLHLYGNHQWNWDYQNQINRALSSSSF